MTLAATYLKKLKQRGKDSHVYRKYQLLGLEVAHILGDEKHKSLYIKLAKEYGGDRLMKIAKGVAERKEVKNPGAYFMKVFASEITAAGIGSKSLKKEIWPAKKSGMPKEKNA